MTNEELRYNMQVRVTKGFYEGCTGVVVGPASIVRKDSGATWDEWSLMLSDGGYAEATAEDLEKA